MNYHFFDYKYNIQGFTSDFFSAEHIIFIILAFISVVFIAIFAHKTKKEKIDLFLKVGSLVILALEIVKISWESYYDITTGRGFNYFGLIPIYTCSVYIYTMLLAGWTRGKVREVSLSFLTTVSLVSGGVGVVYCNGLNYYPFWTFGAFYSMLFHYSMLATGVFLLASGYKSLGWKDALWAWIPVVAISLIAIPVNYIIKSDYMLLYNAGGVPLMEQLGVTLSGAGLRWLFTIIMLLVYIPLGGVVIAGYKGIAWLVRKSKKAV